MKRFFYRFFCFAHRVQQGLNRRFTTSGLAVLVGLFVAAAVGLDTNQTMGYQIFTFLAAVLGIAIASSLFFRYRFSATRILPRFGTAGMKLQYRIVLQSKAPYLQTGLKLFENFADPRPSFQEFLETP
ncbi:MAG: DUF58 domain-containing protein, partial [Leptolyngbyaceae bacterium]|nr:DUF58 domain-containing protein [Leptolyngbyaceae bacterium]